MIIYIHGFASGARSNKAKILMDTFDKVRSINLTLINIGF